MKALDYYKGREQTYLKHLVLESYLERLSWIIGSKWSKFCYVDGFSGPWKSESDDYGDTSIDISLKILSKTIDALKGLGKAAQFKCIFVEKQEGPFTELEELLRKHRNVNIKTKPLLGEFEDLTDKILRETEDHFVLFFIDPSGWKGYGLRKILRIVSRRNSEILINFMYDHISRFLELTIDDSIAGQFDELFLDSRDWRQRIPEGPDREDFIVDYYKSRLKEIGQYSYVTNTRILYPLRERAYFHLIYATRHPKGLKEFKRIDSKMQTVQDTIRKDVKYQNKMSRTGGQTSFLGSEWIDAEKASTAYRKRRIGELQNLFDEMLRKREHFLFKDFLLDGLQLAMIYEKDVKSLVLEAKKNGSISIPNWREQKVPKDDNIIQRKRT